MHFGEHLTIDGYGGNRGKLENAELVRFCLNNLPETLGMHKISTPELVIFPGNDGKDPGGISGFVLIAESHISIHTFPRRNFLTADIYTCQNGMDQDFVVRYFTEKFDLKEAERNFILRGTHYPQTNIE